MFGLFKKKKIYSIEGEALYNLLQNKKDWEIVVGILDSRVTVSAWLKHKSGLNILCVRNLQGTIEYVQVSKDVSKWSYLNLSADDHIRLVNLVKKTYSYINDKPIVDLILNQSKS